MQSFSPRTGLALAGISGAIGVAMGAFGAHALKPVLPLQVMTIFETAVRYHLLHTLALLGTAVLVAVFPGRAGPLRWSGALFVAGIVLFSGSLYGLALSGLRVLGAVTPVGGVAWVAAWGLLAWAFLRGEGGRS